MWKVIVLAAAALVVGCAVTPPQPPAPRTAMPVSASFGRTWDAVIGVFADRNIRIKTVDRSSGLIVAEPEIVGASGDSLADCGKNGIGSAIHPNQADWNVLVRGDSAASTVKATVRFVFVNQVGAMRKDFPCSSLGTWETALEQSVRAIAEGKSASR